MDQNFVSWYKVGSNVDFSSRYSTSFENSTSYLHIRDPGQEDVGEYQCVVNNGIGNDTSSPILFLTNCKFSQRWINTRVQTDAHTNISNRVQCFWQSCRKWWIRRWQEKSPRIEASACSCSAEHKDPLCRSSPGRSRGKRYRPATRPNTAWRARTWVACQFAFIQFQKFAIFYFYPIKRNDFWWMKEIGPFLDVVSYWTVGINDKSRYRARLWQVPMSCEKQHGSCEWYRGVNPDVRAGSTVRFGSLQRNTRQCYSDLEKRFWRRSSHVAHHSVARGTGPWK